MHLIRIGKVPAPNKNLNLLSVIVVRIFQLGRPCKFKKEVILYPGYHRGSTATIKMMLRTNMFVYFSNRYTVFTFSEDNKFSKQIRHPFLTAL